MKSSGYPVLDNRPIDQWKVTELKEELKRRNLPTKGLKEELVRRLDEDMQKEMELEKQETDNGVEEVAPGNVIEAASNEEITGFETGGLVLENSEIAVENVGDANDGIVKLDDLSGQGEIEDSIEQPIGRKSDEGQHLGLANDIVSEEGTLAKNDLVSSDLGNEISENLSSEKALNEVGLQDDKRERDDEGSRAQELSEDIKPIHEDVKLDSSDSRNQVSEVRSSLGFPVKSNSISTDNVSFNEKNELKDNIIADNVKLESDVKPEMVVQPSSSDLVPDGGEPHPSDVEEPLENKVSVEDTDINVTIADVSQKNYSADLGSCEKLNLDRSSGDDSMEEDALESKHIDSNYNSEEVIEKTEKKEFTTLKEEIPIATMDIDVPTYDKGTHSENSVADASTDKRKLSDQETVLNNEPTKRQRRWKSESNSFKESEVSNISPQSPVKDVPQPAVLKRNFSGSKFVAGVNEPPKDREVPPSSKSATNSLRIDHFLRPFTLKAVQELLAKTGTVASFWMDHIKTHCYVTYSSIEEAVETRNAVYNLQWPPNGGRNLVAEFVDPKEVKARLEPPPPPPPPAPPLSSGLPVPEPPSKMPQPSPRQQSLKDRLGQPPTLPPPPPLTHPPHARDRAFPPPPPPPPPQNEKVDAPIVTLDDLFRKTKATPRIYYLPLSEEQVNVVLEARRSNSTKQ